MDQFDKNEFLIIEKPSNFNQIEVKIMIKFKI